MSEALLMKWLIELVGQKQIQGFFGKIEISFERGNITSAKVVESIKPPASLKKRI